MYESMNPSQGGISKYPQKYLKLFSCTLIKIFIQLVLGLGLGLGLGLDFNPNLPYDC